MITRKDPESWQDLQSAVARILGECGFATEVEKTVKTVRGEVEIDVQAREDVRGRKYHILCECKNWKNRVPQAVIHGFRTVVSDLGANIGYIISKAGFQSGSMAAAELTNLKLVTWAEFQAAFEETWLEVFFSPEIPKRLSPLLTYSEPFLPPAFDRLTEEEQAKFLEVKKRHDPLGWAGEFLGPFGRMGTGQKVPRLPLRASWASMPELVNTLPASIVDEVAYRELLENLIELGTAAIKELRAAIKKEPVE